MVVAYSEFIGRNTEVQQTAIFSRNLQIHTSWSGDERQFNLPNLG